MVQLLNLVPAFTVVAPIDSLLSIGEVHTGGSAVYAPIRDGGYATSLPGFEPKFNASVFKGEDALHVDPSGKFLNLNARTALKTDDGANLLLQFTGIVELTPENQLIANGDPNAKTTNYGTQVSVGSLIGGGDEYDALQTSTFVGSGHYIIDKSGLTVQILFSSVTAVENPANLDLNDL